MRDPEKCPRCGVTARLLAMSRTDNKTMVCPACGTHEGVQQLEGSLAPQSEWPLQVPDGYYEVNKDSMAL